MPSAETQLLFAVAPGLLPMVRSGRVRLLAVASAQRVPSMKELPTLAEEGLPGFESIAWNGLFAPAGVPAALVARINADVNSTLREPAVRETLARQGLSVAGGSPTEFEARIAAEARRWGPVITRAGIRIE